MARSLRGGEELVRRRVLDDLAAVHEDHPVGRTASETISWVTTSIVMPSRASVVMTSSTSWTISGSRAEVGSSNSITFGFMASARAIAALLLAAGELSGVLVALVGDPDPLQQFQRLLLRLGLVRLAHLERGEGDVVEDRLVGEEVEALEHHPRRRPAAPPAPFLGRQFLAVDLDRAGVDRLEPVDRAAERGLARADGPSTTTTCPVSTSRLMSRSTWSGPKCLSDCIRIIKGVAAVIGSLRAWRDARANRTAQSSTLSI